MRVLCLFSRGVTDLFCTVKDYIFVALYSLDLSVTAATLRVTPPKMLCNWPIEGIRIPLILDILLINCYY